MLTVINYSDEKFQVYRQLQTQTAYHFGADKVVEYSPADIDKDFYEKNKFILEQPRGAGYWIWKPYIIKDALDKVEEGDIILYADAGAFFTNKISFLTRAMKKEGTNIMLFAGGAGCPEYVWTKRDAFILMECDEEKYVYSEQVGATFFICRKCKESMDFVEEFLKYVQDPRIVTDMPNRLGKENYPGFKENRHDQSVLSLLAKKKNLKFFRNPTQYGLCLFEKLPADIAERSNYPQIFYHHRRAIHLQKTLEDFISAHGDGLTLRDGIRSANFLLHEGMIKESYELLFRLTKRYKSESVADRQIIFEDLLKIFSFHSEIGAPYAEIFQPLLCKMLLKVIGEGINLMQFPSLIVAAGRVENKILIPQEFQDALINSVVIYILEFRKAKSFPPTFMTEKEIWTAYQKLNMPKTPLYENAVRILWGGVEK